MAITTPHRNANFTFKAAKHIEKMKAALTDAAYLHHVIAFAGRMCQINAFSQSNGRVFLPHFRDGSETRVFIVNTCFYRLLCLLCQNLIKSSVNTMFLARPKATIKLGCFDGSNSL